MTAEPSAAAGPGADARKPAPDAAAAPARTKLALERANSIGWFFVESYYELYNQNLENLYKLYSAQASVSHSSVPDAAATVRQASGTDAIKALFRDIKADGKKNKIIITAADIQICLGANILICVSGEWSKNGSPYYQFSQTFVLCPGINELTFDIANDVLKFTDYEFRRREPTKLPEPEQADAVPAREPEPEKDVAKEAAQAAVKEAAKEPVSVKETTPREPSPVAEAAAARDEKPKTAEKEEPVAEEPKTDETTPVSSGNISWAALAATASEKSPVTKPAAPAPKPAAKKVATPSPSLPNGKFKKEDWFPIYIRGCEELEEKTLKEHLSKEFGEIKFFKQNSNIALCDFVDGDGQRKALDARKFTLDGVTVSLEVRESKNGKREGKDFKQFKDKNGNDAKRRNDKKQAPKKSKS